MLATEGRVSSGGSCMAGLSREHQDKAVKLLRKLSDVIGPYDCVIDIWAS